MFPSPIWSQLTEQQTNIWMIMKVEASVPSYPSQMAKEQRWVVAIEFCPKGRSRNQINDYWSDMKMQNLIGLTLLSFLYIIFPREGKVWKLGISFERRTKRSKLPTDNRTCKDPCVYVAWEEALGNQAGHSFWVSQLSPQLLWISVSDPAVPQHLWLKNKINRWDIWFSNAKSENPISL